MRGLDSSPALSRSIASNLEVGGNVRSFVSSKSLLKASPRIVDSLNTVLLSQAHRLSVECLESIEKCPNHPKE